MERTAWEQMEKFFSLSLDLIGIANVPDGKLTRLNPAWEAVLGWPVAELLGRPFIDFVHPDDREQTADEAGRLATSTVPAVHFVNRYRCRDGSYKSLEWMASPDGKGSAFCVARDVTEALALQKALQEKAILLDLAYEGVMVLDPVTSRIQYWNPGAAERYGYSAAEAGGAVAPDLLKSVLPKPREEIYEGALRLGHWTGEIQHTTKAGTPLIIETRLAVQSDSTGHPVGILEIGHDITSRVETERALSRANDDLEERVTERTAEWAAFSYTAAHDLRAPLRAINGFAGVLIEETGGALTGDAGDALDEIRKNAMRMGTLIDDLLAFSRLGGQALKASASTVDMTRLAQTASEALASSTDGRRMHLDIADMPAAVGDVSLLEQVYTNLLSNAFKFTATRDPAFVSIGSEQQDGVSAYFVRDNGVGFDMRFADKIFGIFQRLHARDEYEGTGVGLAIVKRIVERHGGRIWADSALNRGTTVFFTIGRQQG